MAGGGEAERQSQHDHHAHRQQERLGTSSCREYKRRRNVCTRKWISLFRNICEVCCQCGNSKSWYLYYYYLSILKWLLTFLTVIVVVRHLFALQKIFTRRSKKACTTPPEKATESSWEWWPPHPSLRRSPAVAEPIGLTTYTQLTHTLHTHLIIHEIWRSDCIVLWSYSS